MSPNEITTQIARAVDMTIEGETFGEAALRELDEVIGEVQELTATRLYVVGRLRALRGIVERCAKVEKLAHELIARNQ